MSAENYLILRKFEYSVRFETPWIKLYHKLEISIRFKAFQFLLCHCDTWVNFMYEQLMQGQKKYIYQFGRIIILLFINRELAFLCPYCSI